MYRQAHPVARTGSLLTLTVAVFILIGLASGQLYELSDRNVEYANPDAMGYYHCAFWRLADGTTLFSSCDPFKTQRCGRPLEFNYRCCSGFEEDGGEFPQTRGHDTCSKVVSPYKSCSFTLLTNRKLAAIAPDVESIESAGMREPHTIFAPHVPEEQLGSAIVAAPQHVVKGRYYIDDLKDGMQLETLNSKQKLYVTRHPYGVITINCIEVIGVDLECKQGIIHGVRKPLTGRAGTANADTSSLMALLNSYPETRQFAQDLPAEVKRDLADVASGRRYTVLAPRNQAWEDVRRQYSGDKLHKIAAAHVIPKQYCSAGIIQSSMYVENVAGERFKAVCHVDARNQERRYVTSECGRQHEIIDGDFMADNGVMHLIDKPLVPMSVMTLKDLEGDRACAENLRITDFIDKLKECDLYMQPGERYAIIMPTDESFRWWAQYPQFQKEYERFQVDKEYRCRVARYHVVRSAGRLDNIPRFASNVMAHRSNNRNDFLYETTYFEKTPAGSELNFHYSPVNDLRAVEMDGVSLYFTPRINVIPEVNLTDILATRPDLTLTNGLTAKTDMNAMQFAPNAPKNLFLATTDQGWRDPRSPAGSTHPYRTELTMYSGKSIEQFLLLHHVPLYLWGGDIGYFRKNTVHKFMSSVGVELTFWMDENGVMRIGHDKIPSSEWPKVVQWNLPGRDGIIWLLDGVLKCPEEVCPIFLEDVDFYDLYVAACQTKQLPGEADVERRFRNHPIEIAKRHPSKCIVKKQFTEEVVRQVPADRH